MSGNINWWDCDSRRRPKGAQVGVEPAMPVAPAPALTQGEGAKMVEKTPNCGVQSTPVIQPFVVVPYSTPMQPMYHYNDGTLPIGDIDSDYMRVHGMQNQMNPMMGGMNPMMGGMNPMMGGMNPMMGNPMMGGMDDLYYNMDEESEKITKKNTKKRRKKKGVGAVSIIVMILLALFGTLTLFVDPLVKSIGSETSSAFAVQGETEVTLFSAFRSVIDGLTGETAFDPGDTFMLAQCFMSLSTVLFAIVFLGALFSVTRKRLSLFIRLIAFIALVLIAVAVVLFATAEGVELGLAAYALVGLAALVFLISLFGKKTGKAVKKTGKKNRGR